MPNPSGSIQYKRLTRVAFFFSLVAQLIPLFFFLHTISSATYYRAPYYGEARLVILLFGLAGVFLGIYALGRHSRYKGTAIFAILLGLIAPLQHVIFCGGDVLHQKWLLFCPMLWGIRIP